MLPRILDKARASLAGNPGEYIYGNPMDQYFFSFSGIHQDQLLEYVKSGAGDWEILFWVSDLAQPKRAPYEIKAWSDFLEDLGMGSAEDLQWFTDQAARLNPKRTDFRTIMDYLDADDHVSFGGQA